MTPDPSRPPQAACRASADRSSEVPEAKTSSPGLRLNLQPLTLTTKDYTTRFDAKTQRCTYVRLSRAYVSPMLHSVHTNYNQHLQSPSTVPKGASNLAVSCTSQKMPALIGQLSVPEEPSSQPLESKPISMVQRPPCIRMHFPPATSWEDAKTTH